MTELQTSLNRSESHAQAPIESTFSTSPYAMSSTYKYPHSHPSDPMYYASMYETQYNSEPTFNNHFSGNNNHQSFSISSTPQLGSSSTLFDFFGLLS
jgi:hypothetical protein